MRRTDTVCSPGVLRRLLGLGDGTPLGEEPIPVSQKRRREWRGEWQLDPNGQWRFWEYEPAPCPPVMGILAPEPPGGRRGRGHA